MPYIWLLTLTHTTLVETFEIPYLGMSWLVGKCPPLPPPPPPSILFLSANNYVSAYLPITAQ